MAFKRSCHFKTPAVFQLTPATASCSGRQHVVTGYSRHNYGLICAQKGDPFKKLLLGPFESEFMSAKDDAGYSSDPYTFTFSGISHLRSNLVIQPV
jgi:hypothetical protein